MKVSRGLLLFNVVVTVLFAWLYGGDLSDAFRIRTAEVAAFTKAPAIGFSVAALVAMGAAFLVTLAGLLQKRDAKWRGYRLTPIAAVLVFFVDLLVLGESRAPMGSDERAGLAVQVFAQKAIELSTTTAVTTNLKSLQAIATEMGTAPYLLKGEPAGPWTVQVRKDCAGPATDVAGAPVGTFLYCVAKDSAFAWVTVVGLPVHQRFGVPAVLTSQGGPVTGEVALASPDPDDEDGTLKQPE